MNRIYLDHAATTPLDEAVLAAMMPCLTRCWGNPSGVHETAREAHTAVDGARRQIADALGVKPGEVYLTSGGTESDNWALRGVMESFERGHLIVSAVEHHAVLRTAEALAQRGCSVTLLPVNAAGQVEPEMLRQAMRPDTRLVSVMAANNETGVLQPVAELAEIAHAGGALFHTDAVQAVGLTDVKALTHEADLLSLSGHKLYGPKGIGVLVLRDGIWPKRLILGGAQERGQRAGTENVAGIVGLGAAMALANQRRDEDAQTIEALRSHFETAILTALPEVRANGGMAARLPGHSNLCFPGVDGVALLMRLDMAGIAASAGSACAAGSLDPSHVLMAMGLTRDEAASSLRFTFGRHNTVQESDEAAETVIRLARELKNN